MTTAIDNLKTNVGDYNANLDENGRPKKKERTRFTHVTHEKSQLAKIVIPEAMDWRQAAEWCLKKSEEEEKIVRVQHRIRCHPYDGAVAMSRVIREIFGWSDLKKTPPPHIFAQEQQPRIVAVPVGVNDYVNVAWSRFSLPTIEGWLEVTSVNDSENEHETNFLVFGEIKQKYSNQFHLFALAIEEEVKRNSIYKGKALDSRRNFLDLSGVKEENLTLSPDTYRKVKGSLFTPVERTEACRRAGVPLKRGVLLEGTFGVGKTMTSNVLAQKSVQNGWTFLYCHPDDDFQDVIGFAQMYAPVVLFVEDVDLALGEERDARVNKILNTLDGVATKSLEILVVMTTNNVGNIEKALLRPGRIDDVIHLEPPAPAEAETLIRRYGGSLVSKDENLTDAAKACAGLVPAVIREIVEKSKLLAIARGDKKVELKAEDIKASAEMMSYQLKLLNEERRVPSTDEKLGRALNTALKEAMEEHDTARDEENEDES